MSLNTNRLTSTAFFLKKESVIVKSSYIQLQQKYSSTKRAVHLFFEDDDDFEFYRTAITHLYRDCQSFKYLMKGKKNVIDCYKEIDWRRFNKHKVLFFADKDYDDILNNDQIDDLNFFYTRYYSIENYLVNEPMFRITLERFFTKMDKEVEDQLLEWFKEGYSLFKRKLRALTRFILLDRAYCKKIDLDNLKMNDFLNIKAMAVMEIRLLSNFNYLKLTRDSLVPSVEKSLVRNKSIAEIIVAKCSGEARLFTFDNIMKSEKLLAKVSEDQKYLRGKYELWFFLEMVKTANSAIEKFYRENNRPITTENPMPQRKTEINEGNVFDLLSSRLPIPPEVQTFITLNYTRAYA